MLNIVHICPDGTPASGVNCFCTELNRALNHSGKAKSEVCRAFDPREFHGRKELVFHIHGIWHRVQHRAAAWARRNKIPVIWSTHGMTAPWSMRHKAIKKFVAWWAFARWDLLRANVIHSTTETEREWNSRLGLESGAVVPLGTYLPALDQSAALLPRHRFAVLFVGRLHPVKGLENLLQAAKLTASEVCFRIVGPDENGHINRLKALVSSLALESRVMFVGPKYGDELSQEYANSDLLVLPSFTENFGGVVVNALAHARPVIASRFTPWRELELERCGWWVDNSPAQLAQAISSAALLPRSELLEMGARGRALVESRYAWSAVAERMFLVYKEAIENEK